MLANIAPFPGKILKTVICKTFFDNDQRCRNNQQVLLKSLIYSGYTNICVKRCAFDCNVKTEYLLWRLCKLLYCTRKFIILISLHLIYFFRLLVFSLRGVVVRMSAVDVYDENCNKYRDSKWERTSNTTNMKWGTSLIVSICK